jgi:hypothetical protein
MKVLYTFVLVHNLPILSQWVKNRRCNLCFLFLILLEKGNS